jgi:predicted butyrate kinase (DUF1464 family)
MARIIGIDSETLSFDVCGLQDGRARLDATLPAIESAGPVNSITAPPGYCLPLVTIEENGENSCLPFWMSGNEAGFHCWAE